MRSLVYTINSNYIDTGNGAISTTILVTPDPQVNFYIIKGNTTLTANLSIAAAASTPLAGDTFEFRYGATITLGSYSLSVFGKNIPTRFSNKPMVITCTYNGTSWDVVFLPTLEDNNETVSNTNIVSSSITSGEMAASSITATQLATDAVISSKILDTSVLVEKLEDQAKEHSVIVPVHFDYSAKDTYYIAIPTKSTLVRVMFTVSGVAIGATNNATMTITNSGSTVVSAATVAAASSGENTVTTLTGLSNTAIAQGNVLAFTPDGSQTSGKGFLTLTLRREPD